MASPSVQRSLAATVGKVDYNRERRFYEIICDLLLGDYHQITALRRQRQLVGVVGSESPTRAHEAHFHGQAAAAPVLPARTP